LVTERIVLPIEAKHSQSRYQNVQNNWLNDILLLIDFW